MERLSLQHGRLERLAQAHLDEVQCIRASKRRAEAHVAKARLAQDPEYNQFLSYEAQDVSSSPMTFSSAHCTFIIGTIHPHRNIVTTVPTAFTTSSRNVNIVTPGKVGNVDKKPSFNPNLLSSRIRFRHVLIETALWMEDEVPLAVECFDAIYYKLLRINVNHIDKLTKDIRNERLNTYLRNIHELGFNLQSLLKMSPLAREAKTLSSISYSTPFQELFHTNPTDDDKDLA